jgi:hypothetical protein
LYRSKENFSIPPNEKCWGHYRSHVYLFNQENGGPIEIKKISALLSGGESEVNKMIEGFKLEILPGVLPIKKKGVSEAGLFNGKLWRSVKSFSVPCASGQQTLIHADLEPIKTIALRIKSPEGYYIDNSKIWIEH